LLITRLQNTDIRGLPLISALGDVAITGIWVLSAEPW